MLALLLACVPLLFTPDYYFWDDTEIGAYGVWHHYGELLRAGDWPVLKPSMWMAGNIAAEGQWGLWSPVTMSIALLASVLGNALTLSTAVKVVFLVLAALGVHLLARDYGVRPPLALAAGVAVTFNGFTLYMDAPTWVTGLMTWALLPWAWLALRRTTRGGSPLPFLVVAYLLVTIGYFHGTVALCLVLLAVGIDRLLARDWAGVGRSTLGAAFVALLSTTVYLPSVLTAEVTARASQLVTNDGQFNADLGSLLVSSVPTAMSGMSGWWGPITTVPLLYTAWFLPLALVVDWSRARQVLVELRDVLVVLLGAALVVLGPSDIGPLRYPMRFMPYVALTLVLALVVLLDRTRPVPGRGGLAALLSAVALGTYLGYAQRPQETAGALLVTGLLLAAGIAAAHLLLRRTRGAATSRSAAALAGLLVVGTAVGLVGQMRYFPTSPTDHFDMPGRVEDYQRPLASAVNDVIVVGRWTRHHDVRTRSVFDDQRVPVPGEPTDPWAETLMGNGWLVNDASVQNSYSVILHAAYLRTVCMNHRGETCPELLERLFAAQPRVFVPLADLLSVDTVHILKREVPAADRRFPPEGWSVAADGAETVTWTRDEPRGPAGGVVWTSAQTRVTELSRSDREVRLRVDAVPDDGGRVALSRLAWPGYSVDGAELADPVNDYLLAVDLPADSVGDEVTVSFSPPAWSLARATWGSALALAALWTGVQLVLRSRRRPAAGDRDEADREGAT